MLTWRWKHNTISKPYCLVAAMSSCLFNRNRLCYCFLVLLLSCSLEVCALVPERSKGRWNAFPVVKTANKDTCRLYLQASPLIGGPSWLPLHVQVVIESDSDRYKWDFVPLDPTEPSTLGRLLFLQAVPGEIRSLSTKQISGDEQEQVLNKPESMIPKTESLLLRAQEFCDSYQDRNLHLLYNNCWTFAFQLCSHLGTEEPST